MYHYVRDFKVQRYPNIKGLDIELFRQQLKFLKSRFTIIRMEDLLFALGGKNLPENAALLSFDDGYIDHYTTVFPLLDKMGLQGSFFPPCSNLESQVLLDVNKIHFTLASSNAVDLYRAVLYKINSHRGTEFDIPDTETLLKEYFMPNRFDSGEVAFIKQMLQTILPQRLRKLIIDELFREFVSVDEAVLAKELYCDVEQLITMKKRGMFIGLHGFNHYWLGNMEKHDYEKDICHSLDYMDSMGLIDKRAWVMCYPYGSWNDGVVEFIQANGCLAGLTTEVGVAKLLTTNRFLLPRLDTNDFPPKSENYLKLQG